MEGEGGFFPFCVPCFFPPNSQTPITFFQKFFLLLLSLLMSSPTGYSVCSLCKKRCEDLRKIPTEYDGPIFPPSGRLQLQKCCRNCLDFCRAWIQVGFS